MDSSGFFDNKGCTLYEPALFVQILFIFEPEIPRLQSGCSTGLSYEPIY